MGKAGNVCMLLGTALVLAALSLFLWNQREAAEAGRAAEAVLPLSLIHICFRRPFTTGSRR